ADVDQIFIESMDNFFTGLLGNSWGRSVLGECEHRGDQNYGQQPITSGVNLERPHATPRPTLLIINRRGNQFPVLVPSSQYLIQVPLTENWELRTATAVTGGVSTSVMVWCTLSTCGNQHNAVRMDAGRNQRAPALGPTGLPFATKTAHARAHSALVCHPGRAVGHQRSADVLLLGANRDPESGTPQNQRNAAAKYGHTFAGRRHLPAPGCAADDAGQFVVVDSGDDAGQPEWNRSQRSATSDARTAGHAGEFCFIVE